MESHSYQVVLCTVEPIDRQRLVAFAALEATKTTPPPPSYPGLGPAVVLSPRGAPWSSRRRSLEFPKDISTGRVKRVIVTPAVYPRLLEFLYYNIQSTAQKSNCVNTREGYRNAWPGTSARPTSGPSLTGSAPQNQSLFRSYGSNLPTSLTYISLSTRGSSPWIPAADMVVSRDLERLYRKENSSRIPDGIPILLGYTDDHSCDETNINFKLRFNGDILRKMRSVLISPLETNSNVYRISSGVQGYRNSTGSSTDIQEYYRGIGLQEYYRGTGVVQGYKCRVVQDYRRPRVVQEYRCTGIVQCYSGTRIKQVCRNTGEVQKYNGYRSNTGVEEYYSVTRIVLLYKGTGILQGYRSSEQGYRRSTGYQEYRSNIGIQVYKDIYSTFWQSYFSGTRVQEYKCGIGLQEYYKRSGLVWGTGVVQSYTCIGIAQGYNVIVLIQGYNGYTISTVVQRYRSSTRGYTCSTVVQGYRSSKVIHVYSGSTVVLGLCRSSRDYMGPEVVQVYRCTGLVHGYMGAVVVEKYKVTGVEQWYNVYRNSTGVQVYRCRTGVQDTGELPVYWGTGVVQGYRV
ncbi:hypothetical protein HN011_004823 [Eciton burchellii]|nr:hypothetical protein HN011_004823 [Eciton burchellii]